jgi:N-carbamoylputrescine amidase
VARIDDQVDQHLPEPGRIADHRGDLVADMARDEEGVAVATFDLDFLAGHRAAWGFFRDRRTDLYGALTAPRPA